MRVENVQSPYFKAKFINSARIGKKDIYPYYFSEPISFIQIQPEVSSDIDALKNIAYFWEYDKFGKNIYYAACAVRNKSKYYKNHQVYALTSQKRNFDSLNSNQILGLVHTCPEKDGFTFIEHLQVSPEMIYQREPEYKGIGTAILDSLKTFCKKIYCNPSQEKSVLDFYSKNGFTPCPNLLNRYEWK